MHRRLSRMLWFGLLVGMLAGANLPLGAQTISGTIDGTVIDTDGNPLPAVAITVTNSATGRIYQGNTNDQGYYRILEVPPGLYTVTAELPGFQPKQHQNVRVSVNRVSTEDYVLELPPPMEVVVEASTAPLTDTTGATLSTYFPDRQVRELPVLTRDPNNLALLATGVASVRTFSFASTLVPFSVNGSRGRDNNFIIDSVDNNEPLFGGAATQFTNTDVFQEYTILTHQMKAEFGRNSGATINVITKSGSNLHHGTLFWFAQHDEFNARSIVEKLSLLDQPATFYENTAGFTWGGPLKKEKAFFFLSYQWDRARNNLSNVFPVVSTLPTAAGLATLAGLPTTPALQALLNTSTVSSLPLIPSNCFREPVPDPLVSPTNPCRVASSLVGTNLVEYNVFLVPDGNLFDVRDHQASLRLDFPINPTNDFYARYLFDDLRSPRGIVAPAGETAFSDLGLLPDWRLTNEQRTQSMLLNWRHYWVNALNEMRFSFSRISQRIGTFGVPPSVRESQAAATIRDDFGLFAPFSGQFLSAGVRFTLGRDSRPSKTDSSIFQVQDNFSYNRGRHSLKFGVNFVRIRSNIRNIPSDLGQYFFGADLSSFGLLPVAGFDDFITEPAVGPTNAIVAFQRFPNVISDPSGNILGQGQDALPLREFDQFYFFQDDFRIRSNFTLSFGLRYENFGQPINKIRELNPRGPRVNSDENNFAPRFGFAWSPWKSAVIRGGYSIFYNPVVLNIPLLVWQSGPVSPLFIGDAIGSAFWQPSGVFPNQPFTLADVGVTVAGCGTFFARNAAGTVPLLDCAAQDTVDPELANPYVQSWSLTWQQEITPSLMFEFGWVGSKGTKLFQRVDENPFCFFSTLQVPDAGCLARVTDNDISDIFSGTFLASRRDPTRGRIARVSNGGRSTYHAFQFNVTKRLGRTRAGDFAFTSAYTWSHMIDNASEIFGPGVRFIQANAFESLVVSPQFGLDAVEAITPFAQDSRNTLEGERGDSAFDRRHRLAISSLWELPSPDSGAARFLFGGWQFNSIITLQSGQPFSPLNAIRGCADFNGDGNFTNDRPAIGNPNAPASSVALVADPLCLDPSLGYVDLAGNPIDPATVRFVQVPLGVRPDTAFSDGTSSFIAGNAGRNSLTGPGIVNFDFAIFKNFRWDEGGKNLQFRWEIFDLFNSPNPGTPIGNVFATAAQPSPAFAFLPRTTPAGVTGVLPENALDATDQLTGASTFLSRRGMNTSNRRMLFGIKFIF